MSLCTINGRIDFYNLHVCEMYEMFLVVATFTVKQFQ